MNDEPRGHWYLLTGLIIGIVAGLVLSLLVYPVRYADSDPSALSEEYRNEYRRLIADAYSANANLARAKQRLALLKDSDPAGALSAQAQRLLASGGGPEDARALALLAAVLSGAAPEITPPAAITLTPSAGTAAAAQQTPGAARTVSPSPASTSTATPRPSATLAPGEAVRTPTPETPTLTPSATTTPLPTFTPRPTATPPQVAAAPFALVRKSEVCDSSLPAGLIVVEVRSRAGAPLPGVRIQVAWDGGQDTFFTGLSPEISPGYADFRMTAGLSYTLRVGDAGAPVPGLSLPACGGSWKIEFQEGPR